MRFNKPTKSRNKTINHEGEKAYKLSPELELYSLVCTASLQSKFYESSKDIINRLRQLMAKVSHTFTAKLAVYAREEMNLRSIPLVLVAELAKEHKGDNLVSKLTTRIIQRADEITELLAYYQTANERKETKKLNKLSKQLQLGIANAFHKFDSYQLAKYDRDGDIKLRDALFLSHSKPQNKEEEKRFRQLIDGKLPTPYTWETQLSEAGKEGKEKKKVWQELIDSKKVGYMALMRNLRNILDAEVNLPQIKTVASFLSNKKAVENSRQLPFRFLSAYKELEHHQNKYVDRFLEALEEAVMHTANNIQGYDDETTVLLACDVSGSMETTISPRSKVQNFDIGLILGMLLRNRCQTVITGIFGTEFKVKNLPKNSILRNAIDLHKIEGEVGYGTNGYKVLEYLIENKIKVDKIMIFTDCQLWDSEGSYFNRGNGSNMPRLWKEYKKFNPSCKMYLFDLAGYGNSPIDTNNQDVFFIAGWNDKIFNILSALEKGSTAVKEIEKIEV